jgi:hypothetical protein
MMNARFVACAAVAVVALCPAPVLADDAYVCDGGRLVYARPETLEKLKQSDPCIAGYFKFQSAPVAAAPQTPGAADPTVSPQGIVKDLPKAKLLQGKSADAGSTSPQRATPPEATAGTDFRNVRVINAPSDSPSIYLHVR